MPSALLVVLRSLRLRVMQSLARSLLSSPFFDSTVDFLS
jgi:hypothetical protein